MNPQLLKDMVLKLPTSIKMHCGENAISLNQSVWFLFNTLLTGWRNKPKPLVLSPMQHFEIKSVKHQWNQQKTENNVMVIKEENSAENNQLGDQICPICGGKHSINV